MFKAVSERLRTFGRAVAKHAKGVTLADWAKTITVVVAGGWTLYEHDVQKTLERRQGQDFSWATSSLEVDHAQMQDKTSALHVRLKLENTSKRLFTPLFTSWILIEPGVTENYIAIKNTTRIENVNPGETAQDAVTFFVPDQYRAVIVRTKVYYQTSASGSFCGLNPAVYPEGAKRDLLDTQAFIRGLNDVPKVCILGSSSWLSTPWHSDQPGCQKKILRTQQTLTVTDPNETRVDQTRVPSRERLVGCEYEMTERLVELHEKEAT